MTTCLWCGGTNHVRVTSKKCPRHAEWKGLPREKAQLISQQLRDAARSGSDKRKSSKKKSDDTRKRQTLRYLAQAQQVDVYHSLKHRFARYAAADLSNRAAGHVHQRKDEVNSALKIMKDSDLVEIIKRWEKHCERGANRLVCATCGIGSLRKPTKFKISEDAINAFKVGNWNDKC